MLLPWDTRLFSRRASSSLCNVVGPKESEGQHEDEREVHVAVRVCVYEAQCLTNALVRPEERHGGKSGCRTITWLPRQAEYFAARLPV